MAVHSYTGTVAAEPDVVFGFLADVRNLPSYLPLMTAARDLGEGRVEMDTLVKGAEHTLEAWLKVDSDRRRIEWGSAREPGYHGWLEVSDGDVAPGSSTVEYELTTPRDHTLEPYLRAATTFVSNALAAHEAR